MHCRLTSCISFNPRCKRVEPADTWFVRMNAAIALLIQEPAAKRSPILLRLLVLFSFEREHAQCCYNISKCFLLFPARDRRLVSNKFGLRAIAHFFCYPAYVILCQCRYMESGAPYVNRCI